MRKPWGEPAEPDGWKYGRVHVVVQVHTHERRTKPALPEFSIAVRDILADVD